MPELFLHGIEVAASETGARPVPLAASSTIGLVGTAPDAPEGFPFHEPQLIASLHEAGTLGTAGTLRPAFEAMAAQGAETAVVVRVPESGSVEGGKALAAGSTLEATGVHALAHAENRVGLVPRILLAPGFTAPLDPQIPDPVVAALLGLADRLGAICVADGPGTDEAGAVATAESHDSDRLSLVDPGVKVFAPGGIALRPASAYAAGIIARTDIREGFWVSPSNRAIAGIAGPAREVGFRLGAADTETNRLNRAGVATIVPMGGGFRLWGNRSATADALWVHLAVRRAADVINRSIEAAQLWAMDRPFSHQLLLDIRDTVELFGQGLVARGALLGFRAWLDPELNSAAGLAAGQLEMGYEFEPPAPLEHLVFRAVRRGPLREETLVPSAAPPPPPARAVPANALMASAEPLVVDDQFLVLSGNRLVSIPVDALLVSGVPLAANGEVLVHTRP